MERETRTKDALRAVFNQPIKSLVPSSFGMLPARADKMAEAEAIDYCVSFMVRFHGRKETACFSASSSVGRS